MIVKKLISVILITFLYIQSILGSNDFCFVIQIKHRKEGKKLRAVWSKVDELILYVKAAYNIQFKDRKGGHRGIILKITNDSIVFRNVITDTLFKIDPIKYWDYKLDTLEI